VSCSRCAQTIHDLSCEVTGQLWSLATTAVQVRLRIQLNSILFAKTLVRKDIASSAAPKSDPDESGAAKKNISIPSQQTPAPAATVPDGGNADEQLTKNAVEDDGDFSSKAQIMTLMTTDVDRVSEFAWHMFALVGMSVFHRFDSQSLLNLYCRLSYRDCHRFDFPVQAVRRIVFLRFGRYLPFPAYEPLCR
jgi:hypothetical protein